MSSLQQRIGYATIGGLAAIGTVGVVAPHIQASAAETTRTYSWGADQQQPSIPDTVSEGGKTYKLSGTSTPTQSTGSGTVSQYFETDVQSDANADQIGSLQSIVPYTTQYSENGYSGTLNRTSIDYAPVYNSVNQQSVINDSGTITNAGWDHPSDDAIAATKDQDGHTYNRSAVAWTYVNGDASTSVWNWSAQYVANYQEQVLDHYTVVAHYSGTLQKAASDGDWTVTATYTDDATNTTIDNPLTNQSEVTGQTTGESTTLTDNTGNNSNNSSSNDNGNDSNNDTSSKSDDSPSGSNNTISYVSIAAGVAAIVIAGVIVGIVVRNKKHRTTPVIGNDDDDNNDEHPEDAADLGEMMFIPVDIDSMDAELIEFVDDGTDDNQTVVAVCDTMLSPDDDTPTIIDIPVPGERFEPAVAVDSNGEQIFDENGNAMSADYYIVAGDVSSESSATATTDENGACLIGGLATGTYEVRVTDAPRGMGADGIQVVLTEDDTNVSVDFAVDGDDYVYDDVNRDHIDGYPGDCSVSVSVADTTGAPIQGASVDAFRSDILSDAQSDRMVITANGQLLYDGELSEQVKIDGTLLADAINGEVPQKQSADISDELREWFENGADYTASRNDIVSQEIDRENGHATMAQQPFESSDDAKPSAPYGDGSGIYDDFAFADVEPQVDETSVIDKRDIGDNDADAQAPSDVASDIGGIDMGDVDETDMMMDDTEQAEQDEDYEMSDDGEQMTQADDFVPYAQSQDENVAPYSGDVDVDADVPADEEVLTPLPPSASLEPLGPTDDEDMGDVLSSLTKPDDDDDDDDITDVTEDLNALLGITPDDDGEHAE